MKNDYKRTFGAVMIGVSLLTVITIQAQGQIINTIAGNSIGGYSGDGGQATAAGLDGDGCVVFDDTGNIYIADIFNNVIRKINGATGIITTIAGNGYGAGAFTGGYSGDGGAATAAELYWPCGLILDNSNNIYIADQQNNRVRKVSASTGIITTYAGNGTQAFSGDGAQATDAELGAPTDVAVDDSGNIYITDQTNNRIRKVTAATGIISTFAGDGTGGFSGDGGPATAAEINHPYGIAKDDSGNLYISDLDNNCIRKITVATGIINTIAGNGTQGYSGDGGPATAAELNTPENLAVDDSDNVYVPDIFNNRIREITVSNGIISTFAGDGVMGFSGDGGPATDAELNVPCGVGVDTFGNIYICDTDNSRVREVTAPILINVAPNPVSLCYGDSITLTTSGAKTYTWSPATGISATSGSSVIASPSVTTTYTITGKGANGLTGETTVVISIIPLPDKPVITQTGDVLTSSATQGNQWVRNDSALQGATNETYIALIPGWYQVIAENPANGCSSTSDSLDVTSGINQLTVESGRVTVYPNPTGGEINVNINSPVGEVNDWSLQITDVLGRTVYSKQSLNYSNEIDLPSADGVYFICVIDKTSRMVFPIVRQN